MFSALTDTLNKLRREIILREEHKAAHIGTGQLLSGPMAKAFPGNDLPAAAVHEFLFNNTAEQTATLGFTAMLCAKLMHTSGIGIWIGTTDIFPHALPSFGVDPSNSLFIRVPKPKQIIQATEMVAQCDGVACVISEINELDFTQSRRLQLATEHSKVTVFLLRNSPKNLSTASVSRWRICHAPSAYTDLPGIGFPRWNVELLRVRNGRPGAWKVEYRDHQLNYIQAEPEQITVPLRKIV